MTPNTQSDIREKKVVTNAQKLRWAATFIEGSIDQNYIIEVGSGYHWRIATLGGIVSLLRKIANKI